MKARVDMAGQRFGRLTAVRYLGDGRWLCQCDCGTSNIPIMGMVLRKGDSKSCGCLRSDLVRARNFKHGLHGTATYKVWRAIRSRLIGDPNYADVSICDRWNDYLSFLADMGEKPDGMTIDRIDSSKGYEPDNCRWASSTVQAINRRKKAGSRLSAVGVTLENGRFFARIGANFKRYDLGRFDTEEEAGLAYQVAKDRFIRLGLVRYFT